MLASRGTTIGFVFDESQVKDTYNLLMYALTQWDFADQILPSRLAADLGNSLL
jgi:hypothetical protein